MLVYSAKSYSYKRLCAVQQREMPTRSAPDRRSSPPPALCPLSAPSNEVFFCVVRRDLRMSVQRLYHLCGSTREMTS